MKFAPKDNEKKELKDNLSERIRDFGRNLANDVFDVKRVDITVEFRDGRKVDYDTMMDEIAGEIEDKKLKLKTKKKGV